MKIKFDVRKHVVKSIALYIVGILAIPVITCYSIHLKNLAKDYEKFSVVSGAAITESNTLKSLIEKDGSIKEASIYARAYDEQFYVYMESKIATADIVILPNVEGSLSPYLSSAYIELTSNDVFYNESNYQIDNKHFGVKLNSYTSISSQFTFNTDADYFLFIRKSSVHIKHWNDTSKTDLVYNILKDYLNEAK